MANKIDDSSDLLQIKKDETAVSKNYRALLGYLCRLISIM